MKDIFKILDIISNNTNLRAVYKDKYYNCYYKYYLYYNTVYNKIMWSTTKDFILTDEYINSRENDWEIEDFDLNQKELQDDIVNYVNKEFDKDYTYFTEIEWTSIYESGNLTEDFIEKTMCFLNEEYKWSLILGFNKVSEEFICKHMDDMGFAEKGWSYISVHQHLSENFLKKYQDKLDWWLICRYQDISTDFMLEVFNKIKWSEIIKRKCVPFQWFCEHLNMFNDSYITMILTTYPEAIDTFKKLIENEK